MGCGNIQNWGVAPAIIIGFAAFTLLISAFVTIAVTWLYCRIFSKAGYNWVLGLLTLIPILNIIMLCILGLGDWPVLAELRRLRKQATANEGTVNQAS